MDAVYPMGHESATYTTGFNSAIAVNQLIGRKFLICNPKSIYSIMLDKEFISNTQINNNTTFGYVSAWIYKQ